MTTNATAGPEESRAGRAPRTLLELIVNQTDPTAETARALLWRHGLPEDVIDGALCLHAQELAAVQRAAISKTDDPVFYEGEAGWLVSLIEPDQPAAASAVVAPPTDRAAVYAEVADRLAADAEQGDKDGLTRIYRRSAARQVRAWGEELRRLAVEAHDTGTQQQEAESGCGHCSGVGWPRIKGNCPACRRASLFLGTGGYPTCSNHECTEPDAATTVLEQYGREAHPPMHAWRVETRDPLANEWAPGSHFASRPHAVQRYETANSTAPLWRDGTPVERRIVRETTTYTVEEPAPVAQQPAAEAWVCKCPAGLCGCGHHAPAEQQPAAADGEETPVHACPGPDDNGMTPCCGRPPFEMPGDRITRDPDKVTCRGPRP